jgi:hypothetical protein
MGGLLVLPAALAAGAFGLALSASVATASAVRLTEGGLKASVHRTSWEQAFLPIRGAARAVAKVRVEGMAVRLAEGAVAVGLFLWIRQTPDPAGLQGGLWLPAALLAVVVVWTVAAAQLQSGRAAFSEIGALKHMAPPVACCAVTLAYGAGLPVEAPDAARSTSGLC